MKEFRRFYLRSVITLMVLGVLLIPAAPVLAMIGSINLSVTSGPVGQQVDISGEGFTPGSSYTIHFGNTTPVRQHPNATVNSDGTFFDTFTVPDLPTGRHEVRVMTDAGDASSHVIYFTITINPQITLSVPWGYVGNQVTISGSGFTASSTAKVFFDGVHIGSLINTTSTGGLPDTVITIPEALGGSYDIKAQDTTTGRDTPTLSYIILPKIVIRPVSGVVGDQIIVSGSGFGTSSSLSVYFGSISVPTQARISSSVGSFSNIVFSIPATTQGDHIVEVRGGGDSASAIFTVGQKASFTPDSGPAGTTVTVSGTGFALNQAISVRFNGIPVATTPSLLFAGYDGSFAGSFIVSGSAGTYQVEVSYGIFTYTQSFTVVTTGNFEPVEGNVGTEITVGGTGFVPDALVIITFDGVEMASANVVANGAFTATFKAPAVKSGSYQIVATDNINSINSLFTLETITPQVPELLEPANNTRADRVLTFDWNDVTGPSGITYSFQLATDNSFKKLLINEKDLQDSKFSIMEEDKLEPASKKGPYYWRVKAIDSAFNESDWTKASSFYTGFVFDMPSWALYTLLVLGALLTGIFGFWLGRKTAYYPETRYQSSSLSGNGQ